MRKSPLLLFIALLVSLTVNALGQGQHVPTQSFRFLFLDESGGAYYLETDHGPRLINGAPYSISLPVTVPIGQPLEILRADTHRKSADKTEVLTLTPSRSMTSALVVIKPDSSGESTRYQSVFIENEGHQNASQAINIYNMGVSQTAVAIGEEKAVIPPGESAFLKLKPDQKHRVQAKVGEKTPDGWKMLYDGIMSLRPDESMTAVIVYSPSGLRHTYMDQEILENGEPQPGHFWLTYKEKVQSSGLQ